MRNTMNIGSGCFKLGEENLSDILRHMVLASWWADTAHFIFGNRLGGFKTDFRFNTEFIIERLRDAGTERPNLGFKPKLILTLV